MAYQYRYFNGASSQSTEAHAVFLRASFYMMHACMPHVAALRSGLLFLADTRNFSWRTFSLKLELRASDLIMDSYPVRMYRITALHVGFIFRVAFAACRAFMSAKLQRLAAMVGPEPAATEYLASLNIRQEALPETWGGTFPQQALLGTVLQRLKERYENAAKFRL